ncbi:MAG: hypothetical protein J2P17_08260 [Mycobacterium sp.]|nr:hypothetical protein [Mycobacterium sp.]
MSNERRPIEQTVMVCDLCGDIIPQDDQSEIGDITKGYAAPPVVTPKTRYARLQWPPAFRKYYPRKRDFTSEELRYRRYDFHADCILKLIEANLHQGGEADS